MIVSLSRNIPFASAATCRRREEGATTCGVAPAAEKTVSADVCFAKVRPSEASCRIGAASNAGFSTFAIVSSKKTRERDRAREKGKERKQACYVRAELDPVHKRTQVRVCYLHMLKVFPLSVLLFSSTSFSSPILFLFCSTCARATHARTYARMQPDDEANGETDAFFRRACHVPTEYA